MVIFLVNLRTVSVFKYTRIGKGFTLGKRCIGILAELWFVTKHM